MKITRFLSRLVFLTVLGSFTCLQLQAQDTLCNCPQRSKKGKGTLYITAGYNLDWFSKSDIHFKDQSTDDYDFTLYKLRAEDRPGMEDLLEEDITIPQYSFRIGYFFNDKHDLGIEINYDHVKYVVMEDQPVHLTGEIRGTYYDVDTTFNQGLVELEHTNGANYAMLNLVKRMNLLKTKNRKHWVGAVFKGGGGFVYPRSDTRILGTRRNDRYHVAGYVFGVEAGFRYDFFKYFFAETTFKGAYANYLNVLLAGDGRAHHHFFSIEWIYTIGIQFAL
jgi:hypothetical protein